MAAVRGPGHVAGLEGAGGRGVGDLLVAAVGVVPLGGGEHDPAAAAAQRLDQDARPLVDPAAAVLAVEGHPRTVRGERRAVVDDFAVAVADGGAEVALLVEPVRRDGPDVLVAAVAVDHLRTGEGEVEAVGGPGRLGVAALLLALGRADLVEDRAGGHVGDEDPAGARSPADAAGRGPGERQFRAVGREGGVGVPVAFAASGERQGGAVGAVGVDHPDALDAGVGGALEAGHDDTAAVGRVVLPLGPRVEPGARVEQRVVRRVGVGAGGRVLAEDGEAEVAGVGAVLPYVLERHGGGRVGGDPGDDDGAGVRRAQPGGRADLAVLGEQLLRGLVGEGGHPVDVVEVVAAADVEGAEEEEPVAVGQPGDPVAAPLGVAARQQRPVGAGALGDAEPVALLRVGVGDVGVRDPGTVGVVVDRVPRRVLGVAGRAVADPGLRAAGEGPLVYLPAACDVPVAGVRDAEAVRREGRGLLVVGGVGELPQVRAVDAHRPQVALGGAAGTAGLGGVEDHRPPVRGEFGVARVPVGGESAYGAVRVAHVHLGADAVAEAGEDEDVTAGGGVLVVVGGAVPEERRGGLRVRDPAEAAVFRTGEGDPPGLQRVVGGLGGDRLARPLRSGGRADHQQRRQQHHRARQSAPPGMLPPGLPRRASSAGHGPPHSLSMTLHAPHFLSSIAPARAGEQAPSTRSGEGTAALCGAPFPVSGSGVLRSGRAASRTPPRGRGCAGRAGSRPRAARS